jgi:protein-L-isoaspartate(D-aspartate) O-methyltransferase
MSLANINLARFNMIEQQIRPWNVLDLSVLELLSIVKREDFCPTAYKALAFADLEIPLPGGQCMLAPRLEARLLQDLAIKKSDKVLEIGAGSGYMAALLAHQAQHVISLEIVPELVTLARANLAKAGITNAEVRGFDGSKGTPGDGPFDVILLSGSVSQVPQHLLQQLKVGGRLAAIVGDEPIMRATFVTRSGEIDFHTTQPWDANAPRLQNFAESSHFKF